MVQLARPGSGGGIWSEQFSDVGGGAAVQTVMGVEEEIVFNAEVNSKPVKCSKDGGDVLVFPHPHRDPCSAVLDILEPLEAPDADPNEECLIVIQPYYF